MQRRNADGPQAPEKMFSVIHHQRNIHQKHNEMSPYSYQNGYYQKDNNECQ